MACSLDPHIHISLGYKVDSLYPNRISNNSKQNFKAPSKHCENEESGIRDSVHSIILWNLPNCMLQIQWWKEWDESCQYQGDDLKGLTGHKWVKSLAREVPVYLMVQAWSSLAKYSVQMVVRCLCSHTLMFPSQLSSSLFAIQRYRVF